MSGHDLKPWGGFTSSLLLSVLASSGVLAATPPAQEEEWAPLALFVNEEEHGTSTVLLRTGDALVPRADLEAAGLRRLPATALRTVDGKPYVSLASLAPDLRYEVDERALSLRVVASPHFFEATIVNLRPSAPADLVHYRNTGIFLNYAPRLIDFRDFAASGEAGLGVGGHLIYSAASYDPVNGPVRGLSNIVLDEPRKMRRWTIGDSFLASTGPLDGAVFLGGLSVARSFDLDPYFVRFPTPVTSGMALTASTLDVYVNGVLVRRQPVSPGPFQLQGIPAASGAGTTRYVLRDAFGREQQVSSSFYASPGVLSRGVSDYAVAAGAVRNRFGTASWDYGALAMAGRYRVGITDALTLGFRGEVDATHAAENGGPSLTFLSTSGQFDLGVRGSLARDGGGGVAGSLSYLYQSRNFSGGIGARSTSDRYFTLSLAPGDDHTTFGGTAFVSVPVGARATLSANYLLTLSRDWGATGTVDVQSSIILSRGIFFNISASRTRNQDGSAPFEVFATVTLQLGGNFIASTSEHVLGSHTDTTLDVSKPVDVGNSYGVRASVTQGASTLYTASAQGQIQYGQAQVYVTGIDKNVHTEVDAAGGVVFVPTAGVFFTRPVQDGYAVLQVPGAGGVRGYLNNNEIGRTDSAGNLLVPNLLSYYGNRLTVSDQDLPPDYRIDGLEHVVATPYRGAAVVRFDAVRASYVRGTLKVHRSGKTLVPAYGEVTVQLGHRVLSSPIARGGEFEFEDLTPGRHRAHIEYAEGTCDFWLTVAARVGAVAELGEIVCVAH